MRDKISRGKRKDTGEWVFGFYHELDHPNHKDKGYIIPTYASALYSIEVDPETVGQYTGLKDRNGVDIYEGDISEGEHAIYLILWDEQKAQFRAKAIKTKYVLIKHFLFPLWQYVEDDGKCRFRLIGNRFDNPELLGEVRE